VPGAGWSSPIVSGDRVFVTTATEEGVSCRVLAFDRRRGALLWTTEALRQKPTRKERMNSYATPTPVTDGERVYAVFGEGGAAAFSLDGRVLWTNTEHPFYSQHGLGASPILVDGLVLQPRDGSSDGEDKALGGRSRGTGRSSSPSTRGRGGRCTGRSAASPASPRDAGGGDGGRPQAGGEPGRRRRAGLRARDRPPALDGAERGRGRRAVRRAGRRPRGHRLRLRRPALRAYRLGGSGDGGGRLAGAPPGTDSASPLAADGRVYFLSEDCEATAVAAGREFRRLGGGKLPGRCQASIAVASGRLFVRTDTELYAIGRDETTTASVKAFLDAVPDERRRRDAAVVNRMLQRITGRRPAMWGPSIVGFGTHDWVTADGRSTR